MIIKVGLIPKATKNNSVMRIFACYAVVFFFSCYKKNTVSIGKYDGFVLIPYDTIQSNDGSEGCEQHIYWEILEGWRQSMCFDDFMSEKCRDWYIATLVDMEAYKAISHLKLFSDG